MHKERISIGQAINGQSRTSSDATIRAFGRVQSLASSRSRESDYRASAPDADSAGVSAVLGCLGPSPDLAFDVRPYWSVRCRPPGLHHSGADGRAWAGWHPPRIHPRLARPIRLGQVPMSAPSAQRPEEDRPSEGDGPNGPPESNDLVALADST